MPAAYLLDLYDTLVWGDWASWRTELATLTGLTEDAISVAFETTREIRNEGLLDTVDEGVRTLLVAGGIARPDGTLVQRVVDAEAAFGTRIALFDDTLPTLGALRAAGSRLVLVSNCSNGTREIVERLGIVAAMDATILSCELHARKPDAAIYQAALDAAGVSAANAVFVDDQTAYCDAARALGIDTRLIERPTATPFEDYTPSTNGHTVITELAALL
jgi:FMN phosphatase YigB (HAD superfamily)